MEQVYFCSMSPAIDRYSISVVPNRGSAAPWGAIRNTQGCRELMRFFYYIIEKIFSKCRQNSIQIAMGSPLGAGNYISVL